MTLEDFKRAVQLDPRDTGFAASTNLVRNFRGASSRAPLPGGPRPWAVADDDTLPTLAEVFDYVPQSLALNIEVKMPTPSDHLTDPAEVERVVSAVWALVSARAALGDARRVFFSSFDPDVTAALVRVQSTYEVWFLSECGREAHVDSRRTSSAAAIDFAANLKLTGVVVPAAMLLRDEAMVASATARGLRMLTYGLDNNDAEGVARQAQLGTSGVIVDDVAGLMGMLRGASPPVPATPPPYTAPAALGAGPAHMLLDAGLIEQKLRQAAAAGER
eukprot:364991-Chlamydomonas_euryale.AAC.1